MEDYVTMQRRLSLAGRIYKMIPDIDGRVATPHCIVWLRWAPTTTEY